MPDHCHPLDDHDEIRMRGQMHPSQVGGGKAHGVKRGAWDLCCPPAEGSGKYNCRLK